MTYRICPSCKRTWCMPEGLRGRDWPCGICRSATMPELQVEARSLSEARDRLRDRLALWLEPGGGKPGFAGDPHEEDAPLSAFRPSRRAQAL